MEKSNSKAFKEGCEAYKNSFYLTENPFSTGSDRWEEWRDGWGWMKKQASRDNSKFCRSCAWWMRDDASKLSGECHGGPPTAILINNLPIAHWPLTTAFMSCNSHRTPKNPKSC